MTHIIGGIAKAENAREQCRLLMRLARTDKEQAEYKREFRKARNKVLALKRKMND